MISFQHYRSPAWTLKSVMRAIMALLQEPNADSPLNCDAGNLIRSGDMRGFNSMAKMYTVELANEKIPLSGGLNR
jgi:peroxin-4